MISRGAFDAVIFEPTFVLFPFLFPKVDLEVSTLKRFPGCPIQTWFFLPPLAAAVLPNVLKPWTWCLGLDHRRGAAATSF